MTYSVFGGTLNLAQSINHSSVFYRTGIIADWKVLHYRNR